MKHIDMPIEYAQYLARREDVCLTMLDNLCKLSDSDSKIEESDLAELLMLAGGKLSCLPFLRHMFIHLVVDALRVLIPTQWSMVSIVVPYQDDDTMMVYGLYDRLAQRIDLPVEVFDGHCTRINMPYNANCLIMMNGEWEWGEDVTISGITDGLIN